MAPNQIFFKALFLSGVFVINIPGAHLAQSANNNESDQGAQVDKKTTTAKQVETFEDTQTTEEIQHAIFKDKSLSSFAHNIEIITTGGITTLKGPVKSEGEKKAIEAIAARIAGKSAITSEIVVAPQ